jgi:O-antigen/teichoic acid export membrane protein
LLTAIWSFSQQVGVLMAGLSTDGASQVSALQLALSASMLIALPLVVITTITGPELARLNRNGPNLSSLAPSIKATRLAASVSFIVLMPVMLFAEQIIELVYGREFVFAANPIRVLCVAQFVNVCFGLTGQLLISSGLERATVKAQLLGLIVTIVFGLSMVRPFGSLGVAFAMLLGMLTWNFMLARWVSRHFGIGRLLRADIPEGCK